MPNDELQVTLDRTGGMMRAHHQLLVAMIINLPSAQMILADFEAASKFENEDLKKLIPAPPTIL